MKKFITAVSTFAMAAALMTGSALATVQVGVVEGLVKNPDNTAAVGASVDVLCNGTTLNDTTDGSGFYFVQYADGVCVEGETVNVSATLGGLTGNNSGVMTASGYTEGLKLDVAIVHVPLVPEFGLITGALAMIGSAGSFLVLKRKNSYK